MAITPFGRGKDTDQSGKSTTAGTPSTSQAGSSSSSSAGGLTAFIDQGSEFSGKLSFKDTVRIDGRFEGEIESENTLIVGETGQIDANITSEFVTIAGEVRGDITATRMITLQKTARVEGNIRTGGLVVEEGCQINGKIEMGSTKSGAQQKTSKAPPTPDSTPQSKQA